MYVRLYLVGDEYDSNGWTYKIVLSHQYDMYEHSESSMYMGTIQIPEPREEDIAYVGDKTAEVLKQQCKEASARADVRIKEYESKFLTLKCPT